MDLPKPKLSGPSSAPKDRDAADGVPGYDAILSKFHNPFEVLEQFRAVGFEDMDAARRFCSALKAENTDCIRVAAR